MHSKHPRFFSQAVALAAASISLASLASTASAAATITTWSGATSLDWNTNSNWSAVFPGSAATQTAVFTTAPTGTVNVSTSPTNPIAGIWIGNGGGANTGTGSANTSNIAAVNISGQPLAIIGGVLSDAGAATNARTIFFARGGGGAGSFTIGNDVAINLGSLATTNSPRINLAGANKSLTLTGVISNNSTANAKNITGLNKDGDGTLTLTNTGNSYTGYTDITDGTLIVGGNAGTTGGVLGIGTGAVTLGNTTNTTSGQSATLLTSDAYTVGRDISVTNLTTTTPVFTFTATIGTSAASGTSTFSGAVALGQTAQLQSSGTATANFTGAVSGAGGIIKTNGGIVQLSNSGNAYAGSTVVRNGTLLVASPGALGTSSGITLLDSASTATANPTFLTTGGGTITQTILSDTLSTNTGVNTIGTDGSQPATSTVYSGKVTLNRSLQLTSSTDAADSVTFSGQIVDGSASSGLTKVGTGIVILSNASNTYSGGTTVTTGTLATDANGTLGTGGVTVGAAGILTLGNGTSIADLANLNFDSASTINLNNAAVETLANIIDTTTSFTLSAGTYTAAQLNAAFGGVTSFAGSGSVLVTAVPEPTACAGLLVAGLVGFSRRRRVVA